MAMLDVFTGESSGVIAGCYTANEVPGRKVVSSLGAVYSTKNGIANDANKAIPTMLTQLVALAKAKGADAVVGVNLAIGSYQKSSNSPMQSYVFAFGTAVKTEA